MDYNFNRKRKQTAVTKMKMFVTAVCFLFLLKLKWPKDKWIIIILPSDQIVRFLGHLVAFGAILWFEDGL